MPFLVPAGVTAQPPEPTPTPRPRPADPGSPQVVWVAPDGSSWPLTSPALGWHTLDAVTGWGAVPLSISTDPLARGGARVRHIQALPRYITWPLRVEGATHMELVQRWRQIVAAFTQTKRLGPGRLQVYRPDGSAREILAYYQSGMAGEAGEGHTYDTAVLTLFCEDPYWRDINEIELPPWEYVGAASDYLDPYPTVAGQSIDGTTAVTNPGEVEAWPTWTITGPLTSLLAINHTTGEQFTLTGTLTGGQTATIDTYAGTVTGPGGVSWFGNLDLPEAVLWGLDPGVNNVEFTGGGAADGAEIRLRLRRRWETA